ncbi:MAG: type II toxin-antitoxin system prevent-host-death family antitoxin [Bifidobacteriaceae bacterium]|jgi:prevent-host-death family protein|nr:type II toxin-antitoxin system prevent-host-death family antitoxin [Bifidobacteriaceae bacterium]
MVIVTATHARQRWAETLDRAKRQGVTITEHGRPTVMVLELEYARRAISALEHQGEGLGAATETGGAPPVDALDSWKRFSELAQDLADPVAMAAAWS